MLLVLLSWYSVLESADFEDSRYWFRTSIIINYYFIHKIWKKSTILVSSPLKLFINKKREKRHHRTYATVNKFQLVEVVRNFDLKRGMRRGGAQIILLFKKNIKHCLGVFWCDPSKFQYIYRRREKAKKAGRVCFRHCLCATRGSLVLLCQR